jgi:hypothetical protein
MRATCFELHMTTQKMLWEKRLDIEAEASSLKSRISACWEHVKIIVDTMTPNERCKE